MTSSERVATKGFDPSPICMGGGVMVFDFAQISSKEVMEALIMYMRLSFEISIALRWSR